MLGLIFANAFEIANFCKIKILVINPYYTVVNFKVGYYIIILYTNHYNTGNINTNIFESEMLATYVATYCTTDIHE